MIIATSAAIFTPDRDWDTGRATEDKQTRNFNLILDEVPADVEAAVKMIAVMTVQEAQKSIGSAKYSRIIVHFNYGTQSFSFTHTPG